MNNIELRVVWILTNLKYVILSEDEQRHYALEDGDLLFIIELIAKNLLARQDFGGGK
jgi:hypothetical protein